MGTITTGIGLVSGINTSQIIDSLIAIDARPRDLVQQQVAILTSEQTAFQEINAKLLAMKLDTSGFSTNKIFDSTTATSSNPDAVSVTSGNTAAPGTYNFSVARLVSSQQTITNGFADLNSTPVGNGTLSFEFGAGGLSSDTSLSQLNGGAGISRGKIRITDRSGASAVVDLSMAVSMNDVLDAINSASGINVTAAVSGDSLQLTDHTGQTATALTVANVGTSNTATSLGLTTAAAGNTLTGTQINRVTESTLLDTLNDGNGVRVNADQTADFHVTRSDGTGFDVDLSSTDTTLGAVIKKINTAGGGSVTASINSAGTGIKLVDTTTGGSLSVAALNGSQAATDLGIEGSANSGTGTIEGDRLLAGINSKLVKNLNGGSGASLGVVSFTNRAGTNFTVDLTAARSISDVIDAINAAGSQGGNAISASLNQAGNGLLISDGTGASAHNLTITGGGAAALGIETDVASASKDSGNLQVRYISEATDLSSFNGGKGVANGKFTITDSNGASATIDLSQGKIVTVGDLLTQINSRGLAITASVNAHGDGILIHDTGTGNTAIKVAESGSTTAHDLGLFGQAASPGEDLIGSFEKSITISNVSALLSTTNLSDLQGGAGVGNVAGVADFQITRRDGSTFAVDLDGASTINDVLNAISTASGGNVTASVNGDGKSLKLVDSTTGTSTFKVNSLNNSTAAQDLGILTSDSGSTGTITGSSIIDPVTLSGLVDRINAAGLNVKASVINDGSSANPYRLSLTGTQAGRGGAFVFDDGGLGLGATELSSAQNAVVFYGSSDPAKAVAITSATNTLTTLITGATITLNNVTSSPVQVSIARDDSAISAAVKRFVDDFNTVSSALDKYDSYDASTQQKGLLLGDSTIASIRSSLFSLINGRDSDLTGQFNSLSQVGITVGDGGQLQFDDSVLSQALQTDRNSVEQLFTFKQTATAADGTVSTTASGIGVRLDDLVNRLTDTTNGTLQLRNDSLVAEIQLDNDRITQLTTLLDAKRAQLQTQFNNMETTLAQLQSQGNALASLSNIASGTTTSSTKSSSSSSSSSG